MEELTVVYLTELLEGACSTVGAQEIPPNFGAVLASFKFFAFFNELKDSTRSFCAYPKGLGDVEGVAEVTAIVKFLGSKLGIPFVIATTCRTESYERTAAQKPRTIAFISHYVFTIPDF